MKPSPNVLAALHNSVAFKTISDRYGDDEAIRALDFSMDPGHAKFVETCRRVLRLLDGYETYLSYSRDRNNRLRCRDESSVTHKPYFSLLGLFLNTWDATKWHQVPLKELPSVMNENQRIATVLGIPRAYVEILAAPSSLDVPSTTLRGWYIEIILFILKMSGDKE